MELSFYLVEFGFRKSQADYSLRFLDHFVGCLASHFSVKDLGSLSHFLGVIVVPTTKGLFLSQEKYIRDILEEF